MPPPPNNCKFEDVSTTSAIVKWEAPDGFLCPMINYTLHVLWDTLWSDETGTGETIQSQESYLITGLNPYTNVMAEVAGTTEAGTGPSTTCWTVTQEDCKLILLLLNIVSVFPDTWDTLFLLIKFHKKTM